MRALGIGLGMAFAANALQVPPTPEQQAAAFFVARSTPTMWIDPSIASTRFADTTGVAGQDVSGAPTGMFLDRSYGLARGPELVADGRFANGGASWATSGQDATHSITYSAAGMRYRSDTTTPQLVTQQALPAAVSGQLVELTVSISEWVSGSVKVFEQSGQIFTVPAGVGTFRKVFYTATNTLTVTRGSANVDLTVSEVSVKVITGNHVIQPGASKRPLLLQANGLSWISADGSDDGLYTGAPLNLVSVNKVTMIVGLRKRNSDGTAMLVELGPEFVSGGALGLYSTQASPQAYFQWGVSGANGNPTPIMASTSPTDTCVLVVTADLGATSGPSMRIQRIDSAGVTFTQDDNSLPGARNFKSDVLNLLCRNNASLFAPFDMSSFMLIGGPFLTAAELALLVKVTAAKTGITL